MNLTSVSRRLKEKVSRGVSVALPFVRQSAKSATHHGARAVKAGTRHTVAAAKLAHHHAVARPHAYFYEKWAWYAKWHNWKHHQAAHYSALGVYLTIVAVVLFASYKVVFAADVTDNWDFTTPGNYSMDSGIEVSGTSARLKAQEYASDANTAALYHFNEVSGTSAADSSPYSNNATATSEPTWAAGSLNGAATLNGIGQYLSAPDTASLSVTGFQSAEAWIKPNATFDINSTESQTILDKGSYKMNLDHASGKLTYEIQNTGDTWTKRLAGEVSGDWSVRGHSVVNKVIAGSGSTLYAGLGNTIGDAEVWKWNGSDWSKIGGDGVNGSWPDQVYENVWSLAINGDALYAGLGDTAGDAEVWTCSISANCASWTKIGGDGIGPTSTHYTVQTMEVLNGTLYIGTGITAGNGDVYKYTGGVWTQVGGDGLNSSWAASTFETVTSMTSDGTYLYVGLGVSTTDAEVWRFNGTSWLKLGGDGLNSSWNTAYEAVRSMTIMGTTLYAGIGDGGNEAEVWSCSLASSCAAWAKVGGDSVNSSWSSGNIGATLALVNDGTNVFASNGTGTNAGEVWRLTSGTWTRIAGGSVNGSWTGQIAAQSLVVSGSKLIASSYANSTAAASQVWEFSGGNWTKIGGQFLNGSWGGYASNRLSSTVSHNGKLYIGIGYQAGSAVVYEYDGSTTRLIGGNGQDGSWSNLNYQDVNSMVSYKGSLYVGLGTVAGNADVYKWDGSTWTKIGGDSANSSWTGVAETTVTSMTVWNGYLYAGLGNTVATADVWRWDGTTWSQVGGDGINGTWSSSPRNTDSLVVFKDRLCAGLGGSGAYSELWCWSGSGNWVKIGGGNGAGVNSSWSVSADIYTMAVYKDKLYVSVNRSSHIAEIWVWDDVSWTKIAGGGVNGTWADATYTFAESMAVYNGELYVGMFFTGSSSPTGDVYRWDGTAWSQVGGDGINGSWPSVEEVRSLTVHKGKLYAGLGFNTTAGAQLYSFGNNAYVESNTSSFSANWQHVAATYDGVTMKVYVNGVLDGSTTAAIAGVNNAQPLLIGTSAGSPRAGEGQTYFKGSIDEVRISNNARSSFTTKPYVDTNQVISLGTAAHTSGILGWESFTSNQALNGGALNYRLSDDGGTSWKYWNGSAWVTSNAVTDANAGTVVSSHIATFPITFQGIKWQAILKGDGTQQVTLNSVQLGANLDSAGPDTNASAVTAKKASGGSTIASNAWTNGSSPYFSWTAATDSGAGVYGYCLYLGASSSGNPATTKGLLGTSAASTGTNCPFVVTAENLDTAVSGYMSSPLVSSSAPYYLNVKAIDKAGNIFGTSTQFQFRFDNTPPSNPGFISAPSSFLNSKVATLTWDASGGQSASDANSGVSGLQYRIGSGGTWYGDSHSGTGDANDLLVNDGNYTTANPPDYDNLNDGVNTVYFRTWDAAGNVSTNFVTAALKINTTGAPTEPQNVVATPSTNTTNSFAFNWDAPSTFNTTTGNADKLSYCYTVNTTPTVNNCTYTPQGETYVTAHPFATQPGSNTFYVVAKDDFGAINYSSYTSATFTANTSAPGMPTNADVVDVSVKATNNWRLAITWDEPGLTGAGIANYRIMRSTDNLSFTQTGVSTSTSFVDSGLSQQTYFYKVKACDSANNCGAESTTVSLLPTGKFTSPAEQTSEVIVSDITTKRARIAWTTDRASDSKVQIGTASGEYSASEIGNSNQVSSHALDLDNLAAGTTYYFVAKWTDLDGNTGTSQEYTFTTSPAPVLKEVVNISTGLASSTLQFTVKGAAKVELQYGKTDSFGGVKTINTSLTESTYTTLLDGLEDGAKYFYRLIMQDSEGGKYESSIFSFTTPLRPRISDVTFEPVEGEPTSTQKVNWKTNVPTTSQISYGKTGAAKVEIVESAMVTEHTITIRGLADNSEYELIALGRDASGNVARSDLQTFRTALDTRPPKISELVVESTIRGTGSEAKGQLVVSWKTDEPSTSQVAFGVGSSDQGIQSQTTEDAVMTTDHLVIVSDLSPGRPYAVRASSNDNARNNAKSDVQTVLIGRASDSILSIIFNALQQMFGFVSK